MAGKHADACQRAIRYWFRDESLLVTALTHGSVRSQGGPSYERMEFLGDSVIGLVVAEYFYAALADGDECALTEARAAVVSTEGLAAAARACGLDRFLALGPGLLARDGVTTRLASDVFEAVTGAVYLDGGFEAARRHTLHRLRPYLEAARAGGVWGSKLEDAGMRRRRRGAARRGAAALTSRSTPEPSAR